MESKLKYLVYRKVPGLDGGELIAAFDTIINAKRFLATFIGSTADYYIKDQS